MNQHISSANRELSEPLEFKELNKINRSIELFTKDHNKEEYKKIFKIIEVIE